MDKKYRVFDIKISLTHSREVAMAFVIVNKIQEMPSLEKKWIENIVISLFVAAFETVLDYNDWFTNKIGGVFYFSRIV